jgi:hypothetical protein
MKKPNNLTRSIYRSAYDYLFLKPVSKTPCHALEGTPHASAGESLFLVVVKTLRYRRAINSHFVQGDIFEITNNDGWNSASLESK